MFFILRNDYKPNIRRIMIKSLFDILYVSGIDEKALLNALDKDSFEDFEDCLQDECAKACGAEYIVTRNIKDYTNSTVPAITPDEFLKLV